MSKLSVCSVLFGSFFLGLISCSTFKPKDNEASNKKLKIYWFIPDGLRADPEVFTIFKWAEQGHLPHLKQMMENGSYGYSVPSFPGHTPVNFATLLTGKQADEHGVTDGPIRLPGHTLKQITTSGFRSSTRKVDAIWNILDKEGLKSTLISVPGSTPPDSETAVVFRGRWGGWGIDLPALIFQSADLDVSTEYRHNRARHFETGPRMTHYISAQAPTGWSTEITKRAKNKAYELILDCYGNTFYAYVFSEQPGSAYDRLIISRDKSEVFMDLKNGDWSDWKDIRFNYASKEADKTISFETSVRFKVIHLGQRGKFRIRFLLDNLNPYLVQPSHVDEQRREIVGPFTDYVDNYPPQLITHPQDKVTFLEEMNESFRSHERLLNFSIERLNSDAIIHNIYSPNQMLTSRWWMGGMDPNSSVYGKMSAKKRSQLKDEVIAMYKSIDSILAEVLEKADEDTVIILSSDHGVAPLNYEVRLNNLFHKKGWLKYKREKSGQLTIDWESSQVVYTKMYHVYINPDGLGKSYQGSPKGRSFENLKQQVITELKHLKGPNGQPVLNKVLQKSEAEKLNLDPTRVADLIISNHTPFNWSETITDDGKIFVKPVVTGYKQAVIPKETPALWTPFVIMGPGIRKAHFLKDPIHHHEQLSIILKTLGVQPEKYDLELSEPNVFTGRSQMPNKSENNN